MSIKYKTLLIGILTVFSVIGATILIFYFSYFGYINKDQEQRMKRNFQVINYLLENEKENMKKILIDWAQWDDTYKFLEDHNKEYIESNLEGNTIEYLNLSSIIFTDSNRNIVYSKEKEDYKNISKEFVKQLSLNSENFQKRNKEKIGLLHLRNEVYIVGILQITPSNGDLNSNGFLIMAREIHGDFSNYIQKVTPVILKFKGAGEYKAEADNISYINVDDGVIKYNGKYSSGDKLIKDINGEDSIDVEIIDDGYSNDQIIYFLRNFISQFIFLIIVILICDILVIHRYMLKRLTKLTEFIEKVGRTQNPSLVIKMSGKDEIYKLANEINKTLFRLSTANEEILFLSYSDKLTGLRNRAYMEKVFTDLDENKNMDYFIIMGDLNGLKLTNDALGHSEGDKLLCLVGKILKESCDNDDVISRWGGDEFVILTKNKTQYYIGSLIDTIKERCENEEEFHFKISIAWGYSASHEERSGTEAVMSLAEKRMYRNKLMEDKSARSAAINSLLRTLHEKDSETEEHTLRIKNLSVKLGKRIGLTKEKLDELELLSSLHDIGKIGIPDHILMKPSKLTNEEWATMKTHCDIGYRIASSTPELAHIADKILAHHERYDGTGYPNKLQGEKIPLLSRIINIVDSFDVMSHKRIYKDAFSFEYIIEELKRCSGTQFDPYLVSEFIKLLEED